MSRPVVLLALIVFPLTPGFAGVGITLEHLGSHATGIYDKSAAEIGAHDRASQRIFVTNSAENTVDVLDLRQPPTFPRILQIPLGAYGAGPSSVAFKNGLGAVAVAAEPKTDPGRIVFFKSDGAVVTSVVVGALPDAVIFTPDGKTLLVANEGEPNDEYTVDPEGSISIIDVSGDPAAISQTRVRTADFTRFNREREGLKSRGVRIYGPHIELVENETGELEPVATEGGASVAQDLEPELIAVSGDSRRAWVTLQENNALAIVDIPRARVTRIVPLGYKLHALPWNSFDASDRDGGINIKAWPVRGMYLPDGIASFEVAGRTYLITANEGDTRDWSGFSEEARVGSLTLDRIFSFLPDLQKSANLGRLKVTNSPPDGKRAGVGPDGEDVYRKLYSFGGRSISIFDDEGELIWDSANTLERVLAERLGKNFNSDNTSSPSGDTRSDDKGPEPEGVVVGKVNGRVYAFVGLERPGGVAIFDLSQPRAPRFVDYVNHRDFSVAFNIEDCDACETDCGEECLGECVDCKAACARCSDCPEGEDCAGDCARCEECAPTYGECAECTADCPAVQACTAGCAAECRAEVCPQPGVPGRDPLDLGPEGLVFIPAEASPPGFGPLLVVTNEVSGSTSVFRVVLTD